MATYLAHLFLYPTKRGMAERTSIAVLDPPQVIHAAHPLMEVAAAARLGPAIYRGRLKGFGQVGSMLHPSSGRRDKQQQEQNSPNLAEAF